MIIKTVNFLQGRDGFLLKTLFVFATRMVGFFSAFVMNILVARSLSISDAGLFFLVFAIYSILGSLVSLGFPNAFIRHIAVYNGKKRYDVINGLVIFGCKTSIVFAALLAVMIYFFAEQLSEVVFSRGEMAPVLSIMVIVVPIYVVYSLLGFAFQGLHKPLKAVCLQNISNQSIFSLFLIFSLFIGYQLSAVNISILFLMSSILTFFIAVFLWINHIGSYSGVNYSKIPELIVSAKPLFIALVMNILILWGGQIIIGIYLPIEQVALFSVAQRISALISFALVAGNLVVAPRFAEISSIGSTQELRAIAIYCSRVMIMLSSPILIAVLFFPSFFMGLFGESYLEGKHLLQVLALGQFVNVITGSVGYLLNMTGNERIMRNIVLCIGPISLALNLLFTYFWGVVGTAIATSIVLAGQNLFAVYKVKKILKFNTLNVFSSI